jgi:hypothetical protein
MQQMRVQATRPVAQTAKIAPSRIVTCRCELSALKRARQARSTSTNALLVTAAAAVKTVSLFDKLGGKAGVNAAVNKFYEKVGPCC